MSRHEIQGTDPRLTVTVGWDNPMQSFFATVVRNPDPDDSEAEPETVLWLGQTQREILTPEALTLPLAPFAALSAETLAQLRQDRIAMLDRGPSELQRAALRSIAAMSSKR
jgi:hypothetical protein